MYKFLFVMLGTFLFASCNSSKEVAQAGVSKKKTERFVVYGQCGMCKERIEGKLNYTKGVQYAEWNEKDKVLEVSFNPQKNLSGRNQATIGRYRSRFRYTPCYRHQLRATAHML